MSIGGFVDMSLMFSNPGLSLGLRKEDGAGTHMGTTEFEPKNGEDVYESRSGSDNVDEGASGDDLDQENSRPGKRKKKYHRHTPLQIQELEALFKECPHPDEKQRLELSRRLRLESRQVKFWFQNRRTQMKTQLERHENALLRQENDRLKAENVCIRDAMRNPICTACGGPAMLGEVSLEEQHLRIENARLKDELERMCALAGKFLGRPMSSSSPTTPDLPAGGFGGFTPTATMEKSVFLELALQSMDELVKMVHMGEPLWLDGNTKERLNYEEYTRLFNRANPTGMASEATRETGTVIINSLALVETLMDANQWADMFSCLVARATTIEVISHGVGGTRNGALQLMRAELQVLSPLVPMREVNFLRFCKQHADGVWAVVDVSVDAPRDGGDAASNGYMSCRRLPSGCVVQDLPNGYSKVAWVEHSEYDEAAVHPLYRPLLRAGMGLGASRWIATLHRQCECLAILMSSTVPARDHNAITPAGRRSMLKLARRMTDNFCAGVCPSIEHKWNRLCVGTVDADVRVMTRKSIDDSGVPPGVVLSAATSVRLQVPPQRVFDFLRDESLRSEWDILSNGGPMQEMAHIAKGQDPGNSVSLLRASAMGANHSSMLILQETCTDASGSLVVYAPVDIPAMHIVMSGGDSACVALLPSGFAIFPDIPHTNTSSIDQPSLPSTDGCLLTVAFQILVNSLPTAKLTVESVETVNNLISCTVQKIKAALNCDA